MCWYGNEIPLIAEEDIPVIKILKNDRRSPFMKMPYELEKVYKTEILVYKFRRASDVEISNGFHCYDSGCSLLRRMDVLFVKSKNSLKLLNLHFSVPIIPGSVKFQSNNLSYLKFEVLFLYNIRFSSIKNRFISP